MKITIQEGIDVTNLRLAIRQTVIAAAEAEADGRRRRHEELLRLGLRQPARAAQPAQGDLFGGCDE